MKKEFLHIRDNSSEKSFIIGLKEDGRICVEGDLSPSEAYAQAEKIMMVGGDDNFKCTAKTLFAISYSSEISDV